MAGYSQRTLIEKLGYKPGDSLYTFGLPSKLQKHFHAAGISVSSALPATWAHAFFNRQAELEQFLKITDLNKIEKALWVSWPKKSSGADTNLTEQTLRDLILPTGWVDIKVAAIDGTWSGLKFTRRK
ncbi:MAG: hypothetical protein JWS12_481 [Candidatus Saccharibacteria bacterium]|nr:hypothetical protein [Candidatus Saccharibacteria bacterium]